MVEPCRTGLQKVYRAHVSSYYPLPLFAQPVSAGFPSPADYVEFDEVVNNLIKAYLICR